MVASTFLRNIRKIYFSTNPYHSLFTLSNTILEYLIGLMSITVIYRVKQTLLLVSILCFYDKRIMRAQNTEIANYVVYFSPHIEICPLKNNYTGQQNFFGIYGETVSGAYRGR